MLVNIFLMLCVLYLLTGIVFGVLFMFAGIEKLDAGAHGSGIGFRLIIFPGTVALWPVLLHKWIKIKRTKHDAAAA